MWWTFTTKQTTSSTTKITSVFCQNIMIEEAEKLPVCPSGFNQTSMMSSIVGGCNYPECCYMFDETGRNECWHGVDEYSFMSHCLPLFFFFLLCFILMSVREQYWSRSCCWTARQLLIGMLSTAYLYKKKKQDMGGGVI